MMPAVYALLRSSPAVLALVGQRIYRHGRAPQDTVAPYIAWLIVTGDPENNLSDTPPHDRMVVQIDCYHHTDAGVEQLATAVRDALEPHAHMTGQPVDERETETKLFRMALQFDFWVAR